MNTFNCIALTAATAVAALGLSTYAQAAPDRLNDFPAANHAWLDEGAFVAPANVREVREGMTKQQVYTLLGVPHFAEGIGPRYWNYLLNFHPGAGSDFVQCQLRLHFEHGKIDGLAWKEPTCAALVAPQAAAASHTFVLPVDRAPAQASAAGTPYAQFSVEFAFNSAELGDEARAVVAQAAERARDEPPQTVMIVGATDSVGGDVYNLELSRRRARAVREAFNVLQPSDAETVVAGSGKDSQAVATADNVRQQANRRATIVLLR